MGEKRAGDFRGRTAHVQNTGLTAASPGETDCKREARLLTPGAWTKEEQTGPGSVLPRQHPGDPDGGCPRPHLEKTLQSHLRQQSQEDERVVFTGLWWSSGVLLKVPT